jgi:hypothetical protein
MKIKHKKIIAAVLLVLFFLLLSGFYLNFFIPKNALIISFPVESLVLGLSIPVLILFAYDKYFEALDKIQLLRLKYAESYDEKGFKLSLKLKPILGPVLLLFAFLIYSSLFALFSLANFFTFFSYCHIGLVLSGFYFFILFLVPILFSVALFSLRFEKTVFDITKSLLFRE